MFGPTVNGSNRYHNWIDRIIFAARDSLQCIDNFRRKNNRILRLVRISAVPAHAAHGDVYGIDIRVCVTFRDADVSGLHLRVIMVTQREIWFAEAIVKTRFEQCARAISGFLGRLCNQ